MNIKTGKILCGMYNDSRQSCDMWKSTFKAMDAGTFSVDDLQVFCKDQEQDFMDHNVLLAHTCGLPLLRKWQSSHRPVCIPVFDVPGCYGKNYSSWIVARAGDSRSELVDFENTTAAFSSRHSNSGMNVLRHSISNLGVSGKFFETTLETGSHYMSMRAVERGAADIAAIDSVTYRINMDLHPELQNSLKIIGQTEHSPGLPFIVRNDRPWGSEDITHALNNALQNARQKNPNLKYLSGFEPTKIEDYVRVQALEDEAIGAGYPLLQ